jgi:hypothetical protein
VPFIPSLPKNSVTPATIPSRVQPKLEGKDSTPTEKAGIFAGMLKSMFLKIGFIG